MTALCALLVWCGVAAAQTWVGLDGATPVRLSGGCFLSSPRTTSSAAAPSQASQCGRFSRGGGTPSAAAIVCPSSRKVTGWGPVMW